MHKTYAITHEDGITKTKFSVKPSFEQLKRLVDEVSKNYSYEKRLWDMTKIDFDLSTEDIMTIAAQLENK